MRHTKIAAAFAAALLSTGAVGQANATIFTFDLTDTPHSNYADAGFYEYTGGSPRFDAYSFEENGADVKLRYDDASNTALITGTGYNLATSSLAEFFLFYDDITRDGSTLTFADMDVVGAVAGNTVNGKGFNLTLLDDALTGDGWLTNANGGHFGDFHFAGSQIGNGACTGSSNGCQDNVVPAPAPLTLFGALGLFAAWRRRRSTQA